MSSHSVPVMHPSRCGACIVNGATWFRWKTWQGVFTGRHALPMPPTVPPRAAINQLTRTDNEAAHRLSSASLLLGVGAPVLARDGRRLGNWERTNRGRLKCDGQ